MKKLSSFLSKLVLASFFFVTFAPVSTVFIADASAQAPGSLSAGTTSSITSDANENALATVMCNVLKVATGNAGKAFAAFAIISVGLGFFTGKLSWGLMIGVVAGIAAMFGAASIVSAISGKTAFSCAAN